MNHNILHIHKEMAAQISDRLDRCTKNSDTFYNARCPVCGDSDSDPSKRRFFIYQNNQEALHTYCHNCCNENHSTSGVWVSTFAKIEMPDIYAEYKDELHEGFDDSKHIKALNIMIHNNYNHGNSELYNALQNNKKVKSHNNSKELYPKKIYDMTRLDAVDKSHEIYKYAVNRSLNEQMFHRLYITDDFKKSMTNVKVFRPNIEKLWNGTKALIIPMFNEHSKIVGFQGRFMSDKFRFLTLIAKGNEKFFGLEQLDLDKTHYVVEAPLDSLHVENSIATLDSNLNKSNIIADDFVLIYDNQPRNKNICVAMNKSIKNGNKIVIFSPDNTQKDINDMIRYGYISQDLLMGYLEQHTYSGERASDKFLEWKRISI